MKSTITAIVLAFSLTGAFAQEDMKTEVTKRDQRFVLEAGQIGTMEVKLGELAQTNANSAEVRSLAQNMVTDHMLINDELKAYADKKNVFFPSELNKKQQKEYDKLAKLQGKDFDKQYLKCMKKGHKKAICMYKKASKKATDPELKSWAAQKLPQLKHHLEMTENTCKMLK